jgi:hypothetical protein
MNARGRAKTNRERPIALFLSRQFYKLSSSPSTPESNLPPQRVPPRLDQVASDIRELALLQLRLPEDGVRVTEPMLDPSILLDMVQVNKTTRVRIPMRSSKNTPAPQRQRILHRQIIRILGIQHTISKRLTTSHTEQVPRQSRPVRIDIIQRRTLLLGHTSTHGPHAQTHPLVPVDQVGQDLASGGDGDALLVPELVQAALHAQPGEPVLAVGGAAGHGAQEAVVDLDDFLDGLRGDPVAGRGAGVGGDDYAALEAEGEGCGAVGDLDGALGVGVVVCGGAEPGGGLEVNMLVVDSRRECVSMMMCLGLGMVVTLAGGGGWR